MTNDAFEAKLKENDINKRDFSNITGVCYTGVAGWKQKGKTPEWVDSWLDNYEKARKYERIKSAINMETL